jgi:type IV secretory pathway TraG/TraD family ATPase VirD4
MSSYAETNRLITSLATMVTQEKVQQKDPFWNNSARSLLEGLIGFFLEEYKLNKIKREQITMTSIRKFQNSTMEERNQKKFKDYIEAKEYGLKSKDSLTSILSASDNTYKSITAVFGEKMALFDDINVANVTSKSDFEFDLLGRKATALFVIVPDEDKTYYSLVTIIVGLLYRSLVKLANNSKDKKLPVQIDFLLDEFANCPPLSDIEAIVSVARSRGMRFQFFIQSLSQLDNVYGKEVAQIILDNCGLVYLKTNTEETAEAISKRLGKKTIESSSISQSVSLLNYNGNKSTSLIGRDLLTPEEVKQLHYKTIIFPIIGHPIFRDTVVYQKIKCYQEGELNRIPVSLLDLKDTYFTVEQIKIEKRKSNTQRNDLEKDQQEFYNEQKKFEIESFKSVEEIFKKIFEDRKYEILYEEENNRTYASISIDKPLNNREKSLIDNEINKDMYQVNIDLGNNGQGVIEIHLKSPLEIALGDNK